MSPENEGPNSPTILEIDLKNTKKKKWVNMHPTNSTDADQCGNGKLNGHSQNGATPVSNGNGNVNGGYSNGARRDSTDVWSPLLQTDTAIPTDPAVIFGPSNNNEWKGTEEMNNLKNDLHKSHGNNNGSLMNGKNGIGLTDKYGEQDALTGLYKEKPKNVDSYTARRASDDDDEDAPSCGLFGFRPKWARRLASTHMFMVVFLLAWILQGMFLTYFVSIITTIEKLFQIKSRTTGLLLSASEMGQICTAMLLTYYAGRGHRPRWIACGMVLFSIAAFACALPHFIFGDQLLQSNAILNGVRPGPSMFVNVSTPSPADSLNLCVAGSNYTGEPEGSCQEDIKLEQASHSKITIIALCLFFVSLLSSGIGQTAVATLGIPYIDDNVASRESPIYMAITIGVKILGPTSGFIVGSFCTRIFVNLSDPGFDQNDPRWISAWWLGPVIIGTLMLLASIAMFSFPKELRGNRNAKLNGLNKSSEPLPEAEETPKLKDFPKTVRRQLSNDILMCRIASSVLHLLPIAGLYTFLPKYLETQYRLLPGDAALITAIGGIFVMGIGVLISGIFILKLNPSAKSVAAWIALMALIYSCGMLVLMFVGCGMDEFAGLGRSDDGKIITNFAPTCNLTCGCDMKTFAPICGNDGKTYFSSCHAGCTSADTSGNKTAFSNCACIPDFEGDQSVEAVSGYCDNNCKNFIFFICIFAFCVFMHSTSEVGSMLVIMRCTHPKDKAMAMGVTQSAIGLFGNVPCPIIYGAIVDSACLVWKTVCDKHGACSLYDVDRFRHHFLGITAGIMFLAFLVDLVVWSKADRIDIAPDEPVKSTETECEKAIAAPDTNV